MSVVCLSWLVTVFFFGVTVESADPTKTQKLFHDAVEACAKIEVPPLEASVLQDALKNANLNKMYSSSILCIYKSVGIFDDKWEIKKDVIQEFLKNLTDDADKIEEVTDACAKKKGTPEETSLEMFNCVAKRVGH